MKKIFNYVFVLLVLMVAIVTSSFLGRIESAANPTLESSYPFLGQKERPGLSAQNAEENEGKMGEFLALSDGYEDNLSNINDISGKPDNAAMDESFVSNPIEIEIDISSMPGTDVITEIALSDFPDEIVHGAIGLNLSWIDSKSGYLLKKGGPAAGQMNSWLYKTSDGQSWTMVADLTPQIHNYPRKIFFWSHTKGILLTDYHGFEDYVYLTDDGGEHWRSLQVDLTKQLGNYSYLEGEEVSIDDNGNVCIELSAHYEDGDINSFSIPLNILLNT